MKLDWNEPWISEIQRIGKEAGDVLLKHSRSTGNLVSFKSDDSPVTLADMQSNAILCEGLKRLTPGIPVISEETLLPEYAVRKKFDLYWLIDPLDGTREFVKGLEESCVCIALIQNRKTVFSLIDAPFWQTQFLAIDGLGCYESPYHGSFFKLSVQPDSKTGVVNIYQSRTKPVVEGKMINGMPVNWIPMGSALKFCGLARGSAQLYFRWSPFREWDAAAGHLIAQESGARVFGLEGEEITYNNEDLLLKGIIVEAGGFQLETIMGLLE